MMFDPTPQSSRPDSEKGRSGGGRHPHGRRPGPPEPPPDMTGFKMTTIREGFGDAHFFVGPLIICLALFVVGLVWVLS